MVKLFFGLQSKKIEPFDESFFFFHFLRTVKLYKYSWKLQNIEVVNNGFFVFYILYSEMMGLTLILKNSKTGLERCFCL